MIVQGKERQTRTLGTTNYHKGLRGVISETNEIFDLKRQMILNL